MNVEISRVSRFASTRTISRRVSWGAFPSLGSSLARYLMGGLYGEGWDCVAMRLRPAWT